MTQTDMPPSFTPHAPGDRSGRSFDPRVIRPGRSRPRRPRWRRAIVGIALVLTVGAGLGAWQLLAGITGGSSAGAGAHDPVAPESVATGLDPELQRQFDLAQRDAAAEGIDLFINSGWRSAQEQHDVVENMIRKYGSEEEAHRWVLPPSESGHVKGIAIDVGDTAGAYWLSEHGVDYGLCRTVQTEVWHFERIIEPGGECPPMYPDASHGWQ